MLISRESREGGRAGLLTRCHRPSGRQASLPPLPPSASVRPSRCRRGEMQICPAPMKGLTELPAINMLIVFESRDSGLWEWLSSRNDPETLFPGGYFHPSLRPRKRTFTLIYYSPVRRYAVFQCDGLRLASNRTTWRELLCLGERGESINGGLFFFRKDQLKLISRPSRSVSESNIFILFTI